MQTLAIWIDECSHTNVKLFPHFHIVNDLHNTSSHLSCYCFQRAFGVIAGFFVQLINFPRCVIDRPYIPLFKNVRALFEIKLIVATLSVHFWNTACFTQNFFNHFIIERLYLCAFFKTTALNCFSESVHRKFLLVLNISMAPQVLYNMLNDIRLLLQFIISRGCIDHFDSRLFSLPHVTTV